MRPKQGICLPVASPGSHCKLQHPLKHGMIMINDNENDKVNENENDNDNESKNEYIR